MNTPEHTPLRLLAFTATAFVCGEDCPTVKGLNFYGQPEKIRVLWYPFEQWTRKVHFFAPNRRIAIKQLESAGVQYRDLSDGQTGRLVADCIKREFGMSSALASGYGVTP